MKSEGCKRVFLKPQWRSVYQACSQKGKDEKGMDGLSSMTQSLHVPSIQFTLCGNITLSSYHLCVNLICSIEVLYRDIITYSTYCIQVWQGFEPLAKGDIGAKKSSLQEVIWFCCIEWRVTCDESCKWNRYNGNAKTATT